ncbi:DUF2281 domain-containing protein [candidate division KSB1 bacterium]|nr:DUF2281 domain-containing protein [candidate division KSB1 bacterium]
MQKHESDIGKIKRNLQKIPLDKLGEVNDFIEFIMLKYKQRSRGKVRLEGIWKGIGFENIPDLEKEVLEVRNSTSKELIDRAKKWNI